MTGTVSSGTLSPTPGSETQPAPPVAARVRRTELLHGDTRVDDYYWLREKSNPEVAAYLEAENAYTAAVLKPTEAFQDALYREMLGRIQETDLSVPYREGAYFYYARTEEGKQYPTYCRTKGRPSDGVPEEILLDLNELAQGQAFLSLGAFAVSDNGRYLAYSTDTTGFREYTLVVKDMESGQLLPFRVERSGSVAWATDDATLFYTTEDDAKRAYRLHRHRLGDAADEVLYEETDERFRVFAGRSRSKGYLFLASASHTTSEWRALSADQPHGPWTLIAPRRQDHEYDVDHHGDRFYIRTNDRGRNFRLVTAPVAAPGPESWQEIVPHRADVMLEGVELFREHYVLLERRHGLPTFQVTDLRTGAVHEVAFPEPAYTAAPGINVEFDTTLFRYTYESLVTPRSVFDYEMEARTATLLKEQPVLGGYDRSLYRSERLFATAPDGVRLPLSVVYRAGTPREGGAPVLLSGYGSYGYPLPVTFSSNRLSLLDRGVVFALAHVRGGGEMGKAWHDDGRMAKKRNTFTDFIAAAEHLVAQGLGAPDRLVAEGGSAGGLLMGAVANLRPDLFRAIVSKVPFVDVINTMLDEELPLTIGEYEEWGNPRVAEDYAYLKTYCPYTNLAAQAYPAMLVKTSFNDSQVMYWEPAKYVARLRTLKTDDRPLLLKTNMAAGHGGASGRYDFLREVAFDYAFILWQMGVTVYR
jgi:oligopeptidase B